MVFPLASLIEPNGVKSLSIYLMEADVLKGGASAASDLDLFVSYEVIDDA